ncbi:MAG: hypothetical protein M3340_19810, partial [Actinomycetota bacterium]|nr:hypothetical protein [Actinomycetota bacterium]
MLDRCIFAVRTAHAELAREVDARVERLAAYYRPLGAPRVSARRVECLGLTIGAVDFGGGSHDPAAPLCFGNRLPPGLHASGDLVHAGDAELRRLDGPLAAIAAEGAVARIVA